jgi:hypothetical protein
MRGKKILKLILWFLITNQKGKCSCKFKQNE